MVRKGLAARKAALDDVNASLIDEVEVKPRHVDVGHIAKAGVAEGKPPDSWCSGNGFPRYRAR